MDTPWQQLAGRLDGVLGLRHPSVAITFWQEVPDGPPLFEADVPPPSPDGRTGKVAAGCVFWVEAEDKAFATLPEDHFNCSVGSVTHGLKALDEVLANEDVTALLECEWVSADEAVQLPVIRERPAAIGYGPLGRATVAPDVVLLRVNAFQAMVIHDAFPDASIVGKPQCHILPMAREQNLIALSTGCMLSRVRTGMTPDEMTCAVPGDRLEEVVIQLEKRREANAAVGAYANRDSRRFATR